MFVGLIFAALLFIPWSGRVHVPAVLTADQEFYLFAPEPGVLAASHLEPGRKILAGEPLIKLEAPELDARLNNSKTRVQVLELRVNRLGSDPLERPLLQVARQELAAEKARLSGLQNRKENLLVRAPFNGLTVDVDPELHTGQWVGGKRQLAVVRSLGGIRVKGVVEAADRARLSGDVAGTFLPEDPSLPKLKVRFVHLADVSVRTLPEEMLADIHGGRIPTLPREVSDNGELAPRQTWFELELAVENPPENFDASQVLRGTAVLSGEARSFASRIFTQVASVLIRESGF